MTLKEVKKETKQFHCRIKRTNKLKEMKTESIMLAKRMNQHKTERKAKDNNLFKGKCFKCATFGHKASENLKPKTAFQGKKFKKTISYFICG